MHSSIFGFVSFVVGVRGLLVSSLHVTVAVVVVVVVVCVKSKKRMYLLHDVALCAAGVFVELSVTESETETVETVVTLVMLVFDCDCYYDYCDGVDEKLMSHHWLHLILFCLNVMV